MDKNLYTRDSFTLRPVSHVMRWQMCHEGVNCATKLQKCLRLQMVTQPVDNASLID